MPIQHYMYTEPKLYIDGLGGEWSYNWYLGECVFIVTNNHAKQIIAGTYQIVVPMLSSSLNLAVPDCNQNFVQRIPFAKWDAEGSFDNRHRCADNFLATTPVAVEENSGRRLR